MPRAVRKFRKAIRAADTLPPADAVTARCAALHEFFTARAERTIVYSTDETGAQLLKVAEMNPTAAIETLRRISQLPKGTSSAVLTRQQLVQLTAHWLSKADPAKVGPGWAGLMKASVSNRELVTAAHQAAPQGIEPAVRTHLTVRLLERIVKMRQADPDYLAALTVLGDRPGFTEGDWLCVAGDQARTNGQLAMAFSHYRAAEKHGCAPARERRAQLDAEIGYEFLIQGETFHAYNAFRDASKVLPEPDVQLLAAISTLLFNTTDPSPARAELEALRGNGAPEAEIDHWIAVADALAKNRPGLKQVQLPATLFLADDENIVATNDIPALDTLLESKLAEIRAAATTGEPVTVNRATLAATHQPPRPRHRTFTPLWTNG